MNGSSSANDNAQKRCIREGLLRKWQAADLSDIATDEILVRLADARNESSHSANRLMLLSVLAAFLYLLRLEGVASELQVGDYSIANLPFGLFVTSVCALVLGTVALVRTGDARSFDRQLRLACESRYPSVCYARYLTFPNSRAFGEAFSLMAAVVDAGALMSIVRAISLSCIGLFIFLMVLTPLFAGMDYMANGRYLFEGAYENIRFWLILLLSVVNLLTLIVPRQHQWHRFEVVI